MQFFPIHLLALVLGLLEQSILWMFAQPFAHEYETAVGCCSKGRGRQKGLCMNTALFWYLTYGMEQGSLCSILDRHGKRKMTFLPLKFAIRALSKRVAFGDGVFSVAGFLHDPGERQDGVRTEGTSCSPPSPMHQPGRCHVGDSWGSTLAGDRAPATSSPQAWSSAAPLGPYLPSKAPASSPWELLASAPPGCL